MELVTVSAVISLVPNPSVRAGAGREEWRARFTEIREPLVQLEAYLEKGGFLDPGRVRELEAHRTKLRASLRALDDNKLDLSWGTTCRLNF